MRQFKVELLPLLANSTREAVDPALHGSSGTSARQVKRHLHTHATVLYRPGTPSHAHPQSHKKPFPTQCLKRLSPRGEPLFQAADERGSSTNMYIVTQGSQGSPYTMYPSPLCLVGWYRVHSLVPCGYRPCDRHLHVEFTARNFGRHPYDHTSFDDKEITTSTF